MRDRALKAFLFRKIQNPYQKISFSLTLQYGTSVTCNLKSFTTIIQANIRNKWNQSLTIHNHTTYKYSRYKYTIRKMASSNTIIDTSIVTPSSSAGTANSNVGFRNNISAAVAAARNKPQRRRASSFDISLLPAESIRKRELREFSVHYSVSTSSWITTIAGNHNTNSYTRFSFPTEADGRRFGKAYSPPKIMTDSPHCFRCSVKFSTSTKCKPCNCNNCGVQICDGCSQRWGVRMVPKTYLITPNGANIGSPLTVRVCKSCDWLSNAFCMALLQGQHNNAVLLHASGNINLRCCFADIHKEAMFPIHCAVMGGNLDLVKWLIEAHGCPISVRRSPQSGMLQSVQTSRLRTLMDLVMTGRPKVDILAYLVAKNLDVRDAKDPTLAAKTLQTVMSAGYRFEKDERGNTSSSSLPLYTNCTDDSVTTIEDACIICYEKQMNCVLAPCGHQVCCSDCGNQLLECPLCKQNCNVLRIFKS